MARNKFLDMHNHLSAQMERLGDDEHMKEHGELEIERSKAMATIGKTMVENGKLMLEAQKHADKAREIGYVDEDHDDDAIPSIFRIGSK